jgi:YidC/Oxa1 family membrane protein insertase
MTYLILLISNTFASILLTDAPFAKAELFSNNLVKDEQTDNDFQKQFKAVVPLAFKMRLIKMNWYYRTGL